MIPGPHEKRPREIKTANPFGMFVTDASVQKAQPRLSEHAINGKDEKNGDGCVLLCSRCSQVAAGKYSNIFDPNYVSGVYVWQVFCCGNEPFAMNKSGWRT